MCFRSDFSNPVHHCPQLRQLKVGPVNQHWEAQSEQKKCTSCSRAVDYLFSYYFKNYISVSTVLFCLLPPLWCFLHPFIHSEI